jgi:hypothetical protein
MKFDPVEIDGSYWPLRCFSSDDYRKLIRACLAQGYSMVDLEEIEPDRAFMFWRHDVDLSLEPAAKVARIEAEEGIRSTYYILVATNMYNLALPEARAILRQIAGLGHSIGLHFDAGLYDLPFNDLEREAIRECEVLQDASGVDVKTISFHRPAPSILGRKGLFAGRRHTYEPEFFNEIAYVSDSSGGWFRGHPLATEAFGRRTKPIAGCHSANDSARAIGCD